MFSPQNFKGGIPSCSALHCFWREASIIQTLSSLYLLCHFSLSAFEIVSSSLIFSSLTMKCLDVVFFVFIKLAVVWVSWIYKRMSPTMGKFHPLFLQKNFFSVHSLSSPSRTPVTPVLDHLTLSPSYWGYSLFFMLFFLSKLQFG